MGRRKSTPLKAEMREEQRTEAARILAERVGITVDPVVPMHALNEPVPRAVKTQVYKPVARTAMDEDGEYRDENGRNSERGPRAKKRRGKSLAGDNADSDSDFRAPLKPTRASFPPSNSDLPPNPRSSLSSVQPTTTNSLSLPSPSPRFGNPDERIRYSRSEDLRVILLKEHPLSTHSWPEIGLALPGRSGHSLQVRYSAKLRNIDFRRAGYMWGVEDGWGGGADDFLIVMREIRGAGWEEIIQAFPGREEGEVKERYQNALAPGKRQALGYGF
ncbi:hypothetical protein YB2330_005833 [Saitoella coloradoensis]